MKPIYFSDSRVTMHPCRTKAPRADLSPCLGSAARQGRRWGTVDALHLPWLPGLKVHLIVSTLLFPGRFTDPAQLLRPHCLPLPCCPKHLEEVEDIICIEAVVTEAVQDLHPGAQGQLLEGGLPQGVGFPFLQLPAVVDDVLQVAVKCLGSNQGNKVPHVHCSLPGQKHVVQPSNLNKHNIEIANTWRKTMAHDSYG